MNAIPDPVIYQHSYSYMLRLAILERIKLEPPFTSCAKFASTEAKVIQPEHLPYFGSYMLRENLGPDGDFNCADPRFSNTLHVGYSYLIQNNDDELASENLDLAYWSFMKMLHNPKWFLFPVPGGGLIKIEGIPNITHDENLKGRLTNGTPVAELTMEVSYYHRFYFEPIPLDLFEIVHGRAIAWWPDDPNARPGIEYEFDLPQS